jgi:hypothetical protein
MRITVDNSIDNSPILVLGLSNSPAIQIDSIEQRYESFWYGLARFRRGSWFRDWPLPLAQRNPVWSRSLNNLFP